MHVKSGKHHGTTVLGASDAEIVELSTSIATIEAHRDFVGELGFPQLQPAVVGCDNSAAVAIAQKRTAFKRSLYLYRRADFICKAGQRKSIKVVKIPTDENPSDVLTKILSTKKFKAFRRELLNHKHLSTAAVSVAKARRRQKQPHLQRFI